MRRFCLPAMLGMFAVLVPATPAAAQGWGLGIFAKWSGPGPFRGYSVRATLGCWANASIYLKQEGLIPNTRYVAPNPFRMADSDNEPRQLKFLMTGAARATFTPAPGTPRESLAVPVTQAAQAYVCLEYEHSSLFNDDVDTKGAISLKRDGVLMMFVPPIGSRARWLGQFLEIGGGAGMRWYRSESINQRDPYVSAQVLVKPFGFTDNPALKGIRVVYSSDWFPMVTNDDFHLPDGFDHKWQHGLVVAYDFTSFLFDR